MKGRASIQEDRGHATTPAPAQNGYSAIAPLKSGPCRLSPLETVPPLIPIEKGDYAEHSELVGLVSRLIEKRAPRFRVPAAATKSPECSAAVTREAHTMISVFNDRG